jgi:serine/threonine protein kinase
MVGQTLSHYRIIEKLGEGGMGVVYKAEDTKLKRTVALKFLPPDLTRDSVAKERFMHEAQAISRLNHPHVATVYDLVDADGHEFIVLEYIEGGTLKEKIRNGKLSIPGVLDGAIQIANGLAYAHKKEVIHRDIKSDNVMLTGDGEMKITDFGLAKLKGATKITKTGSTVGTAAYMSPEQAQNGEVDYRSDIFSFGVVLYEMATGELPFTAAPEAALMYEIVNTTPKSMIEVRADIPPELEIVVQKAMAKDAAKRYQNAEDLLHDLQAIRDSMILGVKPVISIIPKRNILIPSLIVAGLITICLVWFLNSGIRRTKTSAESDSNVLPSLTKSVRKSVAVIGFKNLSGQPDEEWVSTALSEMLTTELSAGNKFRTIAGENVSRMKIDLDLKNEESFAKQTLDKIRDILGTDYVVMGSYLAAGGEGEKQLRIDLRIQDASMGETLASIAEMGTESKLFDLVAKVGFLLREKLGIGNLPFTETKALRASYPVNPDAVRLYSEGLIKLRTFDALQAKEILLKAIVADSTYALTHSSLAEAWNQLGYELNAKNEAEKAFHLSDGLSEEEKLLVEGRYKEYAKEWNQAIELYKNLWDISPDNVDYVLKYTNALNSAGKGSDGLHVLKIFKQQTSPRRIDPRVYFQEFLIAQNLSDFIKQKEAATMTIALSESLGLKSLVARSKIALGIATMNLGAPVDAIREFKDAMQFYTDVGDQFGIAKSFQDIGVAENNLGHTLRAIGLWEKAFNIYRSIGSITGQADMLGNIGIAHDFLGKRKIAKKKLEENLIIQRRIGNPNRIAMTQDNLGVVLTELGYFQAAKETITIALNIYKKIGDKGGELGCLNDLARIDRKTGGLSAAQKTFVKMLEIAKNIDDKYSMDLVYWNIGFTVHMSGDFALAQAYYDSALSIARQLGDLNRIAYTQYIQASLAMDGERFDDASRLIQSALPKFQELADGTGELDTRTLWAELYINQNNLKKAGDQIDTASMLSRKVNADNSVIALGIIQARLLAARGVKQEALTLIKKQVRKASSYGEVEIILESQLALGEVEVAIGMIDSAKVHLNRLIREARPSGWGRIALKSEEVLRKIGKK